MHSSVPDSDAGDCGFNIISGIHHEENVYCIAILYICELYRSHIVIFISVTKVFKTAECVT